MVQAVLSAKNRFLLERLHTLRHLPPGTSLPQILIREDRQLLEEILQLSDEIDVFSWLQNSLDKYLAKIALRITIEQIGTMCRNIHAAASKVPIPDYYQQLLGGLLELSEDELLLHKLNDLVDSKDEEKLLHDFFQQLQSSYQKSPVVSLPFQGHNERDQLFADLMRLPSDVDPISWLKKTHTIFATQLVLSHLLNRFSITHGSLVALPTIYTMNVKEYLRPALGMDVVIEHITFKAEGFLVQARVTISPDKLLTREDNISSHFTWRGFERVIDNHGYHYLTWVEEMHSGTASFKKRQEQITMAFYPAPSAGVRELTFSSEPVMIETNTVLQEKHQVQSTIIVADKVEWHVLISNVH